MPLRRKQRVRLEQEDVLRRDLLPERRWQLEGGVTIRGHPATPLRRAALSPSLDRLLHEPRFAVP